MRFLETAKLIWELCTLIGMIYFLYFTLSAYVYICRTILVLFFAPDIAHGIICEDQVSLGIKLLFCVIVRCF